MQGTVSQGRGGASEPRTVVPALPASEAPAERSQRR